MFGIVTTRSLMARVLSPTVKSTTCTREVRVMKSVHSFSPTPQGSGSLNDAPNEIEGWLCHPDEVVGVLNSPRRTLTLNEAELGAEETRIPSLL